MLMLSPDTWTLCVCINTYIREHTERERERERKKEKAIDYKLGPPTPYRTLLNNILRRKANWIVHIRRRNCLFHDAIEGQMMEAKE